MPWVHWLVIGLLTLGVVALVLGRRRASVYGAVALGIAVFAALLFLETFLLFLESFQASHHAAAALLAFGRIIAVCLIISLKFGENGLFIG